MYTERKNEDNEFKYRFDEVRLLQTKSPLAENFRVAWWVSKEHFLPPGDFPQSICDGAVFCMRGGMTGVVFYRAFQKAWPDLRGHSEGMVDTAGTT
jgi:hypothetical protein